VVAGSPITSSGHASTQSTTEGERMKFRVELVWQGEAANGEGAAPSIYLTADGRVILQGRAVTGAEREALALPRDAEMISIDRALIRAIKDML
jgi:hypothetical protein